MLQFNYYVKKKPERSDFVQWRLSRARDNRHTTAVHLLRSGVDNNTIRAWLGHVSLDTTNIYAEVDLEMKAKALDHCKIISRSQHRDWNKNPKLMDFLKGI